MTSLTLADSYLHQLSPVIVQFTETIAIRWYGVSYILGFIAGWVILRWMAKSGRSPMTTRQADDLVFAMVLGILVGGRLGYVLFYDPRLAVTFSDSFPWYDLFAINKGGMASHGGMIGVIFAVVWWGWRNRVSALHILDIGSIASTIGLSLGRCANFINAELWGKALPDQTTPAPWWSVKYPAELLDANLPGHGDLIADLATRPDAAPLLEELRAAGPSPEAITSALEECDPGTIDLITQHLTAYYPSQIFQALAEGPILAGLLLIVWARPRKPGVVGCWFLIAYGVLRVATEVVRQPDEGVALFLGLSRGQLLSSLMIGSGLILLVVMMRRSVDKMPALLSRPPQASD